MLVFQNDVRGAVMVIRGVAVVLRGVLVGTGSMRAREREEYCDVASVAVRVVAPWTLGQAHLRSHHTPLYSPNHTPHLLLPAP